MTGRGGGQYAGVRYTSVAAGVSEGLKGAHVGLVGYELVDRGTDAMPADASPGR